MNPFHYYSGPMDGVISSYYLSLIEGYEMRLPCRQAHRFLLDKISNFFFAMRWDERR
jgi:hypothetical protein